MSEEFNISSATVQEACDYAVKRLVEQKGQCVVSIQTDLGTYRNFCSFGDGKGNHCAIGWLEPDNESLMGCSGGLMEACEGDFIESELIKANMEEFIALQNFHDEHPGQPRRRIMEIMEEKYSIDTSGKHWQDWVDMGERADA